MELDKRSRFFIVTFPWNDAVVPTDAVIPSVGYIQAHAKMLFENQSVSVWFSFKHPQRVSKITAAFDQDRVVIKCANGTSYKSFQELPFDWESVHHGGTADHVHVGSSPELQYVDSCESQDGTGTSSDEEFIRDYRAYARIRKRIRELDGQLGAITNRMKRKAMDIADQ